MAGSRQVTTTGQRLPAAALARPGSGHPATLMAVITDAGGQAAGRIGDPDDDAAAIVFLASPAAGYVTGKVPEAGGGTGRPVSNPASRHPGPLMGNVFHPDD